MTTIRPSTDYPLGNTDAEHERLIRQAKRVAPTTERFFREAGIGPGQRVLDIGSGVGDVAMLIARLVGPSGEVVAIERDPKSIAKARARVTEAGFDNVSFNESDVGEIPDGKPFDAAVGRFILMYLPDPVAVLRAISRLVRPGGVLVFQEPYWVPVLAHLAKLPLWFATASLIDKAMLCQSRNGNGALPRICRGWIARACHAFGTAVREGTLPGTMVLRYLMQFATQGGAAASADRIVG